MKTFGLFIWVILYNTEFAFKNNNREKYIFEKFISKFIYFEKYFKLRKMFEKSKEALGKLMVDIKEELTAER